MKKNYVLIVGILMLLLIGGYFGVQKYLISDNEKITDYNNEVPAKISNKLIEKQSSNGIGRNDDLILVSSVTKKNENKGVKSVDKTSIYKLNDYNIQVVEKRIVEINMEPVEASVHSKLVISKNNNEVQNHEFKGSLISIDAQSNNKLLLQFEDVWNEGRSIYEYTFKENVFVEVSKNNYKFIEISDSVWVIHYPNKIKVISLKTNAEKVFENLDYKFLFNNSSVILFHFENSVVAFDGELNKKWEFKSDYPINLVKNSYLKNKSLLYLYDEKSKTILNLNISNGNLIDKITLDSGFYVIDMLSIPKINGLAYLEKNDKTKERNLVLVNQEKKSKTAITSILNSISQIGNSIELKNIYNNEENFTFNLSDFN